MKKTKSFPLLAAVAAATALAATVTATPAGAASRERSQAISCSGTLDIGFLTPLTGAAGFLGQEQLSWAKLAVKTLPPTMGLKIKLVPGDVPVEAGPSVAQTVTQKFVVRQEHGRRPRAVDVRRGRRDEQDVHAGRPRPGLAVRDAHDADEGRQPGGHEGVLPRRARRRLPGPDRRRTT